MKYTLLFLLACSMLFCSLTAMAEDDGVMRQDLTALELTRLMGNGTNLGNTLEACDNTRTHPERTPTAHEVSWGQPVTTQAMLTAMKAAGFDTIRIPVAWMTNATRLYEGDYTIAPAYLDRVEEVVNYARNAGMYVIINDHWDGGWWGMFGSEEQATRDFAMEAYTGMWKQIAERFKNYSDYVIFESANEELGGRFDENSPLYCSDSVTTYLNDSQRYLLCNKVNQAFVDTVRATGGNNAQRFLLIAGYCTNIDQTCDARFVMPTDTAKEKLLVSVHYYDPWSYCGANTAAGATAWGTKKDYTYMDIQLAKMKKFTQQGVGVVIGEYGALPCQDGLKANTVAYHNRFLDLCDLYDMTSCLWDTSGMFVRRDLAFCSEELAQVYLNRNAASEEGIPYADVQAAAQARLDAQMAEAPVTFLGQQTPAKDASMAWLMWNDGSWSLSYSVGDTYNPDSVSGGMQVTDAAITGEGTYTIGLDFTGTSQGYSASVAFAAIGISEGERRFPGYVVDIQEVLINGEPYTLSGLPYTTSDDGKCTRVNMFNEWITGNISGNARVPGNDRTGITATPINRNDPVIAKIKSIYITFHYGPKE